MCVRTLVFMWIKKSDRKEPYKQNRVEFLQDVHKLPCWDIDVYYIYIYNINVGFFFSIFFNFFLACLLAKNAEEVAVATVWWGPKELTVNVVPNVRFLLCLGMCFCQPQMRAWTAREPLCLTHFLYLSSGRALRWGTRSSFGSCCGGIFWAHAKQLADWSWQQEAADVAVSRL